jgi:hypothetical protein
MEGRAKTIADAAGRLKDADAKAGLAIEALQGIAGRLTQVSEAVARAELPAAEAAALAERLSEARRLVDASLGVAGSIKKYTGGAGEALDLAGRIGEIRSTVRSLDLGGDGRLAVGLKTLSALLDKYGGKVPGIGPVLEAYGRTTGSLLDAIARVADTIEENSRQLHVGAGTSHLRPRHNNVLWKQDREVFEAETYAPCGPSYAYRPIDRSEHALLLLWDAPADKWHILRRDAKIEDVHGDDLLLGVALRPAEMADFLLGPAYDRYARDRAAAGEIAGFLQSLAGEGRERAAALEGSGLPCWDFPLFRARFARDGAFPPKVWAVLKSFFDGHSAEGRTEQAERLRQRALAWGCADAAGWAGQGGGGGTWTQTGALLCAVWTGKRPRGTQTVRLDATGAVSIDKSGKVVPIVTDVIASASRSLGYQGRLTSGNVRVEVIGVREGFHSWYVETKWTFTIEGAVVDSRGNAVDKGREVREETYGFNLRWAEHPGLEAVRKFTHGAPATKTASETSGTGRP